MVQLRNGKILVDTLDLSDFIMTEEDLNNYIMTEEEKKEYSDYESDDERRFNERWDYERNHNSDSDEECFCSDCNESYNQYKLVEEDIDIRLFPSNHYYQKLGIDFIMEQNNLLPDPIMFAWYEKLAENIPTPSEDWIRQKNQNILTYTDILTSNDIILKNND
tara:strand:+ start:145 stop:633 length:489 start_codon:yes stop_codon:yes gene_type:complete